MQLVVNLDVIRNKMDSLEARRARLVSLMNEINQVIRILTAASWVSMAARAFLRQFEALSRQIEESIRRVEGYRRDLDVAFNVYSQAERRLTEQASALGTNVFNV